MVVLAALPGLVLAGAGPKTAITQEIIVKNDAVVTNATLFVVLNNFTIGDQAGARLIIPCDGRIVGVQVGWWGSFPIVLQSTETALHIFEDGTFPVPGPELATVLNPLLISSPSLQPTINEYRTLDAALTMPINIPVIEGEAIILTLEFANPTNVGAGGPNVVSDFDNSCAAEGNVLFSSASSTWFDACTIIGGDLVFRLIVVCDVEGACCLADGSCALLLPNDCTTQGGQFEGQGVDCASAVCPQPDGACCLSVSGGCLDLTATDCGITGGLWKGFGTDCASFECFPPGACCLQDGMCTDIGNEIDCTAAGGTFQGVGTTCAGLACPLPCPADVSLDGSVNVTDLLSLLGKWGVCGSPCPEDINTDGSVNVTDLLALLGAWGACP